MVLDVSTRKRIFYRTGGCGYSTVALSSDGNNLAFEQFGTYTCNHGTKVLLWNLAADRMIRFGEAYYNTRTRDYDLTAGEIEINDSDKDKSSGVLLPAAQLIINKEGQLEFQLYQNPWKLTNIIDWHKAGVPE